MKKCLVFVILWIGYGLFAGQISNEALCSAARTWLAQSPVFEQELPRVVVKGCRILKNVSGDNLPLMLVELSPSGYLIMGADTSLPPVIAFSTSGKWPANQSHPLVKLTEAQGTALHRRLTEPLTRGEDYQQVNQAKWERLLNVTRSARIIPEAILVPNFVDTEWSQWMPFNYYCPCGKLNEENRSLTGCVQTATAQLMNYYQWPPYGRETVTHHVNNSEITAVMKADLTWRYDWSRMVNVLHNEDAHALTEGENEVARLMVHLGIMNKASYGLEATSASTTTMVQALSKYMYYSSGNCSLNASSLYPRIKSSMQARHPALVSFRELDGHAFLVSGWTQQEDEDYYYWLCSPEVLLISVSVVYYG